MQSCWMLCTLVIAIGTFPYTLCTVAIPWSVDQDTITLQNLAFINLVSIFRCSSPPSNLVYGRRVSPSVFTFSLSSHRHFYMFSVYLSLYSFLINKPITLANCSFINLVYVFRYYGSSRHLVYASLVDPWTLPFSLTSHRHSNISLLLSSRFIDS